MSVEQKLSIVEKHSNELANEFKNPAVVRALTATIFKDFKNVELVKQACLESMINGYSFQDILKKKIYAIPFGSGYSLVQSIGDVRAIAMKSGQVGKDEPIFEEDKDGKIISCSVTIKKMTNGYVGNYTAKVFFKEYNKGRDNWKSKPRTMISKVAEMHAIRMAFPEQLEKAYIEEEFDKDNIFTERVKEAKKDIESVKMKSLEVKTEIKTEVDTAPPDFFCQECGSAMSEDQDEKSNKLICQECQKLQK